jgi:hypothetical protein
MTLVFPNLSRSFDTTRGCVRFSGYDRIAEVPFFVEGDAIRAIDNSSCSSSQALLAAFDRNRDRICRAAVKAYSQRREGSYTLKPSDF